MTSISYTKEGPFKGYTLTLSEKTITLEIISEQNTKKKTKKITKKQFHNLLQTIRQQNIFTKNNAKKQEILVDATTESLVITENNKTKIISYEGTPPKSFQKIARAIETLWREELPSVGF